MLEYQDKRSGQQLWYENRLRTDKLKPSCFPSRLFDHEGRLRQRSLPCQSTAGARSNTFAQASLDLHPILQRVRWKAAQDSGICQQEEPF